MRHLDTRQTYRAILALVASVACATAARGASTYDLRIHSYCSADGTACGFADQAAYERYLLDAVQEMNLEWKSVGVSFRPKILLPIVTGSPYQTLDYCCGSATCNANELSWRQNVALNNPKAISLMLRDPGGSRTCCSTVPSPGDDPNDATFHGVFCDMRRPTSHEEGALLAHEMGHHFCLPHTWRGDSSGTAQDTADTTGSSPTWDLDVDAGINDTPPDLQPKEVYPPTYTGAAIAGKDVDLSGNNLSGHEWCGWTIVSGPGAVDAGSPHKSWYDMDCRRQVGTSEQSFDLGTSAQWAMASGYGFMNRGPYVIDGQLFPAFSSDSKNRILDCKSGLRAALSEVCASRGGDTDSDGICNQDDNCGATMNTSQGDSDGDGWGDACDLMTYDPSPSMDLDGDALGLLVDLDNDNDGCSDVDDQHPHDAQVVVGTKFTTPCGYGVEAVYAFEGNDTDGDGVLDCQDRDDDNDGLCDESGPLPAGTVGTIGPGCSKDPAGSDVCPLQVGTFCRVQDLVSPCPEAWLVCAKSDCDPFVLKVVISNPDPFAGAVFDQFRIIDRTIYAGGLPGRALSQSARVLQGDFSEDGSGPTAGTVRLEIWSRDDDRFIAMVAQYDADAVQLGDFRGGRFLAIAPSVDTFGNPRLVVGASDVIGVPPGEPPGRDADDDGVADALDSCTVVPNPLQTDSDGDGFGNACDADLDGDQTVSGSDVDTVQGCQGADLLLFLPEEDEPLFPPNPVVLDLARRCGPADLDEDGRVDGADLSLARAALDGAPGPTLIAHPAPRCAAGQTCDDADPCTEDRCLASGGCLHVPRRCEDNDPCTIDACDPGSGGCEHLTLPCDDGNPCTVEACDPATGQCAAAPASEGLPCDDGNACTVDESCQTGFCSPRTTLTCDDSSPCTTDSCDGSSGECLHGPPTCDDGNPCTEDACGREGCSHAPVTDGTPCDDADACTLGDACAGGVCAWAQSVGCDDGDACSTDACEPATGQCRHEAVVCDDGNELTYDACDPSGGPCVSTPIVPSGVGTLEFTGPSTLRWQAAPLAARWNTYRGTIPSALMGSPGRRLAYDHICFESADLGGDGPLMSTDFSIPPEGSAFYYAVSGENDLTEGPAVVDSTGAGQPPLLPCGTPP
jgi:hypothetical protein